MAFAQTDLLLHVISFFVTKYLMANAFKEYGLKLMFFIRTLLRHSIRLPFHYVLVSILRATGFGESILYWFNSFLVNRFAIGWHVQYKILHFRYYLRRTSIPTLFFSMFVNSFCSSLRHITMFCLWHENIYEWLF